MNEFMARIVKTAMAAALFLSALICFFNTEEAIAFLLGAAWNSLNLFIIKELAVSFITLQERNGGKLVLLTLLKFPLLYGSGVLLLYLFPAMGLAIGSGFVLVILLAGGALQALKMRRLHG